jgi:PAS domain S-box-containing protein
VGRRLVLGERTEEETEATLEALPPGAQQVGFYSYGELSPFAAGRCDLHNQTMTLTADQDRYTMERAMEVSSQEMQALYEELGQRTQHEISLLRHSDERHRLLFHSNPLPMWVIDAETLNFVDVNHAMVTTYGYSRDEFLAMTADGVKLPGDVPLMVEQIQGAVPNQIQHIGLRKHRCKNGTVIEVDITVHGLVLEGRRCVVAIALDMTKSRRVEEELRQAQKMEAVGRIWPAASPTTSTTC